LYKIKDMDLEFMNGRMEGNMKDSGIMENNMGKVTIMSQMAR